MTTQTGPRPTTGIAVPAGILRKGKAKARKLGTSFSAYVSMLIHHDTMTAGARKVAQEWTSKR